MKIVYNDNCNNECCSLINRIDFSQHNERNTNFLLSIGSSNRCGGQSWGKAQAVAVGQSRIPVVGLPFAAQVSAQISATSDDAACCNCTLVNCITDTNCFHEKT
jgi:hypothetical protein